MYRFCLLQACIPISDLARMDSILPLQDKKPQFVATSRHYVLTNQYSTYSTLQQVPPIYRQNIVFDQSEPWNIAHQNTLEYRFDILHALVLTLLALCVRLYRQQARSRISNEAFHHMESQFKGRSHHAKLSLDPIKVFYHSVMTHTHQLRTTSMQYVVIKNNA